MITPESATAEAQLLDSAEINRKQTRQTTSVYPDLTIDDAYAIQAAWLDLKLARGEKLVGHKIGLTSRAMQQTMNITTPDSGFLTDRMVFEPDSELAAVAFCDPKLEVELAFVLATDLGGTDLGIDQVLDATEYVVPAIELIAARSFRRDPETGRTRTVVDTISDNAADAGIICGGDKVAPREVDLRWISALGSRNGVIEESGVAAAVLGHPALGIVWLARRYAEQGLSLEAGQVILAGSFTRPIDIRPGDDFHFDYGPLGSFRAEVRVMAGDKYHQERLDTPPAPSGCPMHATWSPLNNDYLAEPYHIAAQLRDEHPVFYAEQLGYLVVSEMAEIERIFTDHETFASVNVQDPVFPLAPEAQAVLAAPDFDPIAVMSNRPEPDHGRIRKYTRQGFSNRRIKTLEPYIRRRGNELIDTMLGGGAPTEFVHAFAFPLPGETVFRFIGFPEADDEMLKNWCGDRKAFSWGHPTGQEQTEIAEHMLAYWRYCREFTASKRDDRGDDLASELIDAHEANPDDLSYREVESVVYGLSFAGHEAVTAAICNTLLCLLPRREVWAEICADPSLIPNAIEEVMRFNSSQISWRRLTTVDTNVGGYDVPTGTAIFMNFAAANRQADIFEDPDTFDIHRSNAAHNISFGKGVHYCLGAKFAKYETQLVTEMLAERVPSLRLVDDQSLTYFPNITFRGPTELHVAWD